MLLVAGDIPERNGMVLHWGFRDRVRGSLCIDMSCFSRRIHVVRLSFGHRDTSIVDALGLGLADSDLSQLISPTSLTSTSPVPGRNQPKSPWLD